MADLTIIILSYNTKTVTLNCIESILKSLENSILNFEVIIVDNGSNDGTVKEIKNSKCKIQNYKSKLKIIENKENLGFARANNQAIKIAQGEYLLFLNSDIVVKNIDFGKLITYLTNHPQIGVLTVKLLLLNGQIDPACHRGFPTLWRSFCYFSGSEKLFGQLPILNRTFGGYHMTYFDKKTIHEIDSPSGAFYLTRKNILAKTGGFDERFFMYGEDLDLSYQIRKLGYKVVFYPLEKAVHLKYQSGLKGNNHDHQKKIREYFYQAMKLFYQKNYSANYPKPINSFVYLLIDLMKK